MKSVRYIVSSVVGIALLVVLLVTGPQMPVHSSPACVSLAIGSGGWAGRFEPMDPNKPAPLANRFGRRPAVLIAWRNTSQIENVEVLVRNLGECPGSGRLRVDLIDARTGKVLATRPGVGDEIRVNLPSASKGGREGRIYNIVASRKINNLIDQLDREHTPYLIRATVTGDQPDLDPSNNVATKSYFTSTRVMPNATHHREFYFANNSGKPVDFQFLLRTTEIPPGWKFEMTPSAGSRIRLAPGETFQGIFAVRTPRTLKEAQHVDALVSGIDPVTRQVLYQDEWFAVVENQGPRILSANILHEAETNMIVAKAVVEDLNAGIMEASGVQVEYTTTEEPFTLDVKTMAYDQGNFMMATSFTGRIGPFEPNTMVLARVTGLSTAGLAAHSSVFVIKVPSDAKAKRVPPPPTSPFVEEGGDVFVPTFPR